MALILPFRGHVPQVAADAFIADNATLIGDVIVGPGSSIWYGTIVRGDTNSVRIGARTNLQDATVVHVARAGWGTTIGDDVLIGHMAIVHACRVENNAFIGMNACVMDEAIVEEGAMVAAGALIPPGKRVKTRELWAGRPGRFVRVLSDEERTMMIDGAAHYVELAREHRKGQVERRGGS